MVESLEFASTAVTDLSPVPACTPSLMPFHVSYNGPAPISRYFCPRPAPSSVSTLSVRSSSATTLVAEASSISILSETQSSSTAVSSTISIGNEELSLQNVTSIHAANMEVDSETQPVLDAVDSPVLANTPTSKKVERLVAAFRGRQLYGQVVDMPQGYGGLVLRAPLDSKGKDKKTTTSSQLVSQKARSRSKTRATRRSKNVTVDNIADAADDEDHPNSDEDQSSLKKTLTPSSTFSSFTLWTPDRPLDEGKDEYARALVEWIHLAREIHVYDE